MQTRTAAPASSAPEPRTRRGSRGATVAVLLTFGVVALVASRPGSPLTPPLFAGAGAPSLLLRLTDVLGLDALSRDSVGVLGAIALACAAGAFVYALRRAWAGELSLAMRRVQLARRFHNDIVVSTRDLRRRRLVTWLRLSGHAPMPSTIELEDGS